MSPVVAVIVLTLVAITSAGLTAWVVMEARLNDLKQTGDLLLATRRRNRTWAR